MYSDFVMYVCMYSVHAVQTCMHHLTERNRADVSVNLHHMMLASCGFPTFPDYRWIKKCLRLGTFWGGGR